MLTRPGEGVVRPRSQGTYSGYALFYDYEKDAHYAIAPDGKQIGPAGTHSRLIRMVKERIEGRGFKPRPDPVTRELRDTTPLAWHAGGRLSE